MKFALYNDLKDFAKLVYYRLNTKYTKPSTGIPESDLSLSVQNKLNSQESGGDINIIESVSVNNSVLTPDANKGVNITVPTKVSDLTNDSGFTTNNGTITGIKMNGSTVGSSGVVDLGTVIVDVSDKAPINSPSFTGTPTVPTAENSTNNGQIASTEFVKNCIEDLINSSPAALDTLKELADALGNDPNFSTTITNNLALKAPLASPLLTGTPTAPTANTDTNNTLIATTAFVHSVFNFESITQQDMLVIANNLDYGQDTVPQS